MKGKQFYFLLIGLILVGVGSVFLYRQREEQRVLEFEGYEISAIESRVEALYNEERTDIAQGISDDELEEIDKQIDEARKVVPNYEWQRYYPHLSRDCGGDILNRIVFKGVTKVKNAIV